jgi:hypothetical protein
MRRRSLLVIGLFVMSGCASLPDREERRYRLAKWWKGLSEDVSIGSYQAQSDADKARHERTLVNDLNASIGNTPYRH